MQRVSGAPRARSLTPSLRDCTNWNTGGSEGHVAMATLPLLGVNGLGIKN